MHLQRRRIRQCSRIHTRVVNTGYLLDRHYKYTINLSQPTIIGEFTADITNMAVCFHYRVYVDTIMMMNVILVQVTSNAVLRRLIYVINVPGANIWSTYMSLPYSEASNHEQN